MTGNIPLKLKATTNNNKIYQFFKNNNKLRKTKERKGKRRDYSLN